MTALLILLWTACVARGYGETGGSESEILSGQNGETTRKSENVVMRVLVDRNLGPCGQTAAERLAWALSGVVNDATVQGRTGDVRFYAGKELKGLPPGDHPGERAESYAVRWDPAGVSIVAGRDERGLLCAVSDIVHRHRDRLNEAFQVRSSPALRTRGLWSWTKGIYDVEAYIERMSWWKYNTLTLWNEKPPKDAKEIQAVCDRLGIGLYWGYSWGWDYPNATPVERERLNYLIENFPSNGTHPCPTLKASRELCRDYVIREFEERYLPIGARAIYFQTFTEAPTSPAARDIPTGELVLRWVQPIVEELLERYPYLRFACGIHNTHEDFHALKDLHPRCALHWEREHPPDKAFPASTIEKAKVLTQLRGENENCALLFRLYGSFGLKLRGRNLADLHERIERNWEVVESGEGGIDGAQAWVTAYHPEGGQWLANPKVKKLRDWVAAAMAPEAKNDGVIGLLEGSLWSVRPRTLPALFAEMAWNADTDDRALEAILQQTAWFVEEVEDNAE